MAYKRRVVLCRVVGFRVILGFGQIRRALLGRIVQFLYSVDPWGYNHRVVLESRCTFSNLLSWVQAWSYTRMKCTVSSSTGSWQHATSSTRSRHVSEKLSWVAEYSSNFACVLMVVEAGFTVWKCKSSSRSGM